MSTSRRTFLKRGSMTGIGAVLVTRLSTVIRPLVTMAASGMKLGLHVSAVGPLAGRATWPAICAIGLRNARANAAMGIAGSAAALASAMRLFAQATKRPWYDPVLRPSLRNLITGAVR